MKLIDKIIEKIRNPYNAKYVFLAFILLGILSVFLKELKGLFIAFMLILVTITNSKKI